MYPVQSFTKRIAEDTQCRCGRKCAVGAGNVYWTNLHLTMVLNGQVKNHIKH